LIALYSTQVGSFPRFAAPDGRPWVAQGATLGIGGRRPPSPGGAAVAFECDPTVAPPGLEDSGTPIESPGLHPGLWTVAPPGLQETFLFEVASIHRSRTTPGRRGRLEIGFVPVRQAKSGGSSQLKGTDHGNCSCSMKLPSGVTGDRAVGAWGCEDVSRNASEPDSASLKP
jgi:hypothetical protein